MTAVRLPRGTRTLPPRVHRLTIASEPEDVFQRKVIQYAKLRRWMAYHTHDSRRSPAGFPDLVLVRPPRVLFCELKSTRGRLSAEQTNWLGTLYMCPGVSVHVWRPSDWDLVMEVLA